MWAIPEATQELCTKVIIYLKRITTLAELQNYILQPNFLLNWLDSLFDSTFTRLTKLTIVKLARGFHLKWKTKYFIKNKSR
jgi:hypothetical protein